MIHASTPGTLAMRRSSRSCTSSNLPLLGSSSYSTPCSPTPPACSLWGSCDSGTSTADMEEHKSPSDYWTEGQHARTAISDDLDCVETKAFQDANENGTVEE